MLGRDYAPARDVVFLYVVAFFMLSAACCGCRLRSSLRFSQSVYLSLFPNCFLLVVSRLRVQLDLTFCIPIYVSLFPSCLQRGAGLDGASAGLVLFSVYLSLFPS